MVREETLMYYETMEDFLKMFNHYNSKMRILDHKVTVKKFILNKILKILLIHIYIYKNLKHIFTFAAFICSEKSIKMTIHANKHAFFK